MSPCTKICLFLIFVVNLLHFTNGNTFSLKGETTIETTEATPIDDERIVDFKEGLSEAGRLLGLDTAQGVAQLVSQSFAHDKSSKSTSSNSNSFSDGIMSGFFRLLGLDSSKLSAVTLNSLIFLAQLISTSIIKNKEKEKINFDEMNENELPDGSPLDWILALKKMDIIRVVEDSALAERFIEEAEIRAGWDTANGIGDCAIALICRVSPFVHGLQKALITSIKGQKHSIDNNDPVAIHWPRMSPIERMYAYMPSAEQLQNKAEDCDERFPGCSARIQDS